MSLVHVRREEVNEFGRLSWSLYDPAGVPITVFSEFCRKLGGAKFETRRRYATVVARFIDYLYEVKVLGGGAVTRAVLNDSIDYYLELLRSGENISLRVGSHQKGRYQEGDDAREAALKEIARRLSIKPLASGSWSNTIAALNNFLRLCSMLEREAKEMAILKGGIDRSLVADAEWDYKPLLEAVDGVTRLSRAEAQHLKQSTMLGGVIRFRSSTLVRPKGLQKSARQQLQIDQNFLDFPLQHFPALIAAATSWRDRALWTLLLASGIRRSEALNLQWCDINFSERMVYVLDPDELRYGREMPKAEREKRFKGRAVSRTYLFLPYRTWFFEYLKKYRAEEYRLPEDQNDFVFQYLISPHFGRPLVEASDETLNSAFTSAVIRAQIPGPSIAPTHVWTGHSLRHAYGVYMLNDYVIPNQALPGLTIAEVQQLMGHKHVSATKKYARERATRLQAKLKAHDRLIIQGEVQMPCLEAPGAILQINAV
ncbi:Phage integrase family protein [Paracidovorax konjaci]|uniref:Phage integrase family protein n=2 Tax=Paracidovorax konjaci TaxID=32040 RepID=A0A1I1TVE2_9BURK|nr:Phage integrase family protein [Paracidovorax konjaci]